MQTSPSPNVFAKHDHRRCRVTAIAEARSFCDSQGLRLTPVRARVLEILLESHKALGAYEILDRLKEEGLGGQPPVVYRALEFLVANGFVHRLERLNAFTACNHASAEHEAMFLICQKCLNVAEKPLDALAQRIDNAASGLDFQVQSRVVEVVGFCPECREEAAL